MESSKQRNAFREYVASEDPGLLNLRCPSVLEIATALVAVGAPIIGLYNVALMQLDRELLHRISYALSETAELRVALQEHKTS